LIGGVAWPFHTHWLVYLIPTSGYDINLNFSRTTRRPVPGRLSPMASNQPSYAASANATRTALIAVRAPIAARFQSL